MTEAVVVSLMNEAMRMTTLLAAPLLLGALVVGLIISIFQAVTQIQEQTLTFVPKLVCVSLAIVLSANFILKTLTEFCTSMINMLPTMAQ